MASSAATARESSGLSYLLSITLTLGDCFSKLLQGCQSPAGGLLICQTQAEQSLTERKHQCKPYACLLPDFMISSQSSMRSDAISASKKSASFAPSAIRRRQGHEAREALLPGGFKGCDGPTETQAGDGKDKNRSYSTWTQDQQCIKSFRDLRGPEMDNG